MCFKEAETMHSVMEGKQQNMLGIKTWKQENWQMV